MDYRFILGKLCGSDIAMLRGLERKIRKQDIHAMEQWATFLAFDHPELETEPILLFLKEYVNKTIQKYKQYSSKEALLFDASAHNVCDFTVCVAWCIDMLQAYDKWRESEAMC